MPLSEEEQRLLEQMEEALAAEDPKFASALRGAASRQHHKRVMFVSIVGFVVGVAILMTGAVQMITLVAVGGFLVMLGSAYARPDPLAQDGRARPSGQRSPDRQVQGPTTAPTKQSGFMNRMEDRWRRRRDDY